MAKRKANKAGSIESKSRGKPKGDSRQGQPSRLMMRPLAWRLILMVIIVALLFLWWSVLVSWAGNTWEAIWGLFGWGLVFLGAAVGILVGFIRRRKLSLFLYHWNRWLGGIILMLVVWAILGFAKLGGSFGLSISGYDIVDYPLPLSVLRVVGLGIIGIFLVAPRASLQAITGFFSWFGSQFKRRPAPAPRPVSEQQPSPPPVTVAARPSQVEREVVSPQSLSAAAAAPARPQEIVAMERITSQAQQDLKQVAQDVWKKYGESPALVVVDGWRLPPIDILDVSPEIEFSDADNVQRARLIEEALASYGVDAKVVQINAGPTVTQFGLEPGWDRKMKEVKERDRDGNVVVRREELSKTRVKVERITSLANDLALALAAPSIRMEAPVPGKSVVGVEVPNAISSSVSLRGVIETGAFQKLQAKAKLSLALGKGAGGEAVVGTLDRMPHLLIAGATGSGKTVCLNSIICCLLMYNTPYDVRFIMVDPKRVELTPFNSIPHLATPVIVETNKALDTLRWLNQEMDKRYQTLATTNSRNIESYNKNREGDERLPYLVLIIDELADLMMTGFDEVEHILCRLAQLARATGIHLVVATQRPSVDVVTGLIKANFPTRISFAVTSQVDSRTILDAGGAEKLLGRGDMLYMPTEAGKPKRLQGCYVSDAETERIVYFWNNQRREEPASPSLKVEELVPPVVGVEKRTYPQDPLLDAARQLAEEYKHISTSFLQRRLRIGYPRAARIMEQLEEEGFTRGEEG
ncbi:DNA translocase FtsK [Chloroflexota bacterium]